MTDNSRFEKMEIELAELYQTNAPETFVKKLQAELDYKTAESRQPRQKAFLLRPVWLATALVVAALIVTFFAIGPARVAAAVQKLLGYVPGSGLVSTEVPLRVLAEPVEQTRDGVTITISSALLSADKTQIDIRVFGIPREAYPNDEAISGCMTQEYLRLPDGSELVRMDDYPAVPANVNEAVLVIPCLANTLPGKAPENWELKLRFVPAPEGFTVLPVEEVSATPELMETLPANIETGTPTPDANAGSLTVTNVVNTENGYALVVSFLPGGGANAWVQQTGMPTLTDAAGKTVPYNLPLDILNSLPADPSGADVMAYQFNASGVTFPITIHYKGSRYAVPQPEAKASFTFDAGATPQPGQEWLLNQTIELAGHTLVVEKIIADSRGGYNFFFKADKRVNTVAAAIVGHTPNGGGGGGPVDGKFNLSLSYAAMPTGILTVELSNLSEITEAMEWTTQWSPATERTDIADTPQLAPGVCADAAVVAALQPLPASIKGKALFHQVSSDGSAAVVLSNLDGSDQKMLTTEAGWEALSGNGQKAIYSSPQGFVLLDIATGVATPLNLNGYDPVLSFDGSRLAYVNASADGINFYDVQSGISRRISDRAYAATVGWSADGTAVYIADMAAGGSAWQIRKIDVNSGVVTDGILIENGSYKSLDIAMSPDEKWVAYRGRDNASVFIAQLDGSEMRLLLEAPSTGTSGIAWGSKEWLGVSLMDSDSKQKMILVNPDSCEVWVLPQLNGTLRGVVIE